MTYTRVVFWFAQQMLDKLGLPTNMNKKHWTLLGFTELMEKLKEEQLELKREISNFNWAQDEAALTQLQDIIEEASDVANVAMMIADKARTLQGKGLVL